MRRSGAFMAGADCRAIASGNPFRKPMSVAARPRQDGKRPTPRFLCFVFNRATLGRLIERVDRGWRHFNPHPFLNPAWAAGAIASGLFNVADHESTEW
jgi:hypothetical protein